MTLVKRALSAIKRTGREFTHAVKNPETYVVPSGHKWDNMSDSEKKTAIKRQKQVRGESVEIEF